MRVVLWSCPRIVLTLVAQFTILLVGYFVLGPSDLYKLVKEIGKFIQNFRTLGQDLTTTFESNMESQLQLEELRKAQRELNDAFSFRRSINVDDSEAFATTVDSPRPGYEAEEAATTTTTAAAAAAVTGKKRLRRRKKKVEEQVPDLELPESESETLSETSLSPEEEARINAEFDQYVGDDDDDEESWLETPEASESDTAAAAARFQQQLSGNWNTQILENQDQLEPLADVMQRLAILEQEKSAAEHRLQEEFERRAALETEYYAKQRQVLEEAAAKVQASVYASAGNQTAVPSQS